MEERTEKSDQSKPKAELVKSKLSQKSQVYKALQDKGHNIKNLLVDFEQKKYDNQTEAEKLKYEQDREKFYSEKREEIQEQEADIIGAKIKSCDRGLTKALSQQEKERLLWEKEML